MLNWPMSKILAMLLFILPQFSFAEDIADSAIFFIGDGIGQAYLTGTRIWKYGSNGKLAMESLPITGISKTYASDNFVTDSAASGTAMATGVKTYSGSIGMSDKTFDPSKSTRPLQSILDVAISAGKSVGIVTTDEIVGATPAAFYGHVPKRSEYESLARQLSESKIQLFLGGGRRSFFPKSWNDPDEPQKSGIREDGKNIIEEMKTKNWKYIHRKQQLNDSLLKSKKVIGLFDYEAMLFETSRKKHNDQIQPTLPEMVKFSIKYLRQNPKGYLLIVEQAHTDFAGHMNWAEHAFVQTLELDKAVFVAMKMASPKTLLVVTADHETSGLSLSGYWGIKIRGSKLLGNVWGPSYLNEDAVTVQNCTKAILTNSVEDINKLSCYSRAAISWATGPGGNSSAKVKEGMIQHRAAYHQEPNGFHTAVDVAIMAGGPGQFLFTGYMNNSDIPKKILKALGLKFTERVNIENFGIVENTDFWK